jgi:hypothetical protein
VYPPGTGDCPKVAADARDALRSPEPRIRPASRAVLGGIRFMASIAQDAT